MSFRISVDTGGTFTDAVVADSLNRLTIGKSLTTPERAFLGVRNAVDHAAEQLGLTATELLGDTDLFIYGTTRATNAIVTRQGAKTAFVTTRGFRDTLVLKEGGKRKPHDFSSDFPSPYISRRRTFEITERMSSEGTVSVEFDEAQARHVVEQLASEAFEAVAVSFLWSIANPAHELRMGAIIEELLPDVPYTLSHQLVPIVREYRRASATAIDASLKPLMQKHLQDLELDLREAGYPGDVLISTSIGGCNHVSELVRKPIQTAKSGPAMAPVSSRFFSNLEGCGGDIIVCDTGGTTFDVGLVRDNELVYSRDTWLGGEWTGHLLGISSVDIRSVGAGGGSIAWIDDGGLLRVGPQSAGSVPGPACYGRGGDKATVSDAACVLGYFDPNFFLGGRMSLDVPAARRAVGNIAEKLGKPIEETAYGILTLASEVMIKAIHDITVAEGINPQDSVIVAGGGAAGINIMLIAKELGCKRVLLPKEASALSACGMQFADIVSEEAASLFTTSADFDAESVSALLDSLDAQLEHFRLSLSSKQSNASFKIEYFVEARYASQVWDIVTTLPERDLKSAAGQAALFEAFHQTHERLFALRDEGSAIEFISWKARLIVATGVDRYSGADLSGNTAQSSVQTRLCHFGEDQSVETRVYKQQDIRVGTVLNGPCIIEEPTTTIVVFPGMFAEVTPNGHYLLSFE